jgi:uncharacterized coiled-coil DUF342 family protein
MQNLKITLVKIKNYIKKYYKQILIISGIVFLFILAICQRNNASNLITSLKSDILKRKKEIASLEAVKANLSLKQDDNKEKIEAVEQHLSDLNDEISFKRSEVKKMTMKDKLKSFNDLGY